MPDVFGTPEANDATAEFDRIVDDAGRDHAEMIEIARTEVMNRRIGSKKVSPQDQMQEYGVIKSMALEGNIQPGIDFLTSQDATMEEAISYFTDMERKRRNA